jgi:hypothetical protein
MVFGGISEYLTVRYINSPTNYHLSKECKTMKCKTIKEGKKYHNVELTLEQFSNHSLNISIKLGDKTLDLTLNSGLNYAIVNHNTTFNDVTFSDSLTATIEDRLSDGRIYSLKVKKSIS